MSCFPGNRTIVCVYKKKKKYIRDWDTTDEKEFSSGNGGFRDLAFAACCERLLPSDYVNFDYSTSCIAKVKN